MTGRWCCVKLERRGESWGDGLLKGDLSISVFFTGDEMPVWEGPEGQGPAGGRLCSQGPGTSPLQPLPLLLPATCGRWAGGPLQRGANGATGPWSEDGCHWVPSMPQPGSHPPVPRGHQSPEGGGSRRTGTSPRGPLRVRHGHSLPCRATESVHSLDQGLRPTGLGRTCCRALAGGGHVRASPRPWHRMDGGSGRRPGARFPERPLPCSPPTQMPVLRMATRLKNGTVPARPIQEPAISGKCGLFRNMGMFRNY